MERRMVEAQNHKVITASLWIGGGSTISQLTLFGAPLLALEDWDWYKWGFFWCYYRVITIYKWQGYDGIGCLEFLINSLDMEQKNSDIRHNSQDPCWRGAFKGQMPFVWMLCGCHEPKQAAAVHTWPAKRGAGPESWAVLKKARFICWGGPEIRGKTRGRRAEKIS